MAVNPEDLPYRPCVGLVLFNHEGKVFVGKRIDTTAEAWQLPQGGIDDGEDPEQALFREAEEEIGTRDFTILVKTDDWLTYDLPPELIGKVWKGRFRGQRQKWFAARLNSPDSNINIHTHHPEFNAFRWVELNALPDLIVPFKRELYIALVSRFSQYA
jgi:putative (di)nucleoside polyphosphate hydrolase